MQREQQGLFGGARMQMDESIKLSLAGLATYMLGRDVVAIANSGGKDSTTVLSLTVWAILSGHVPAPRRLVVLWADTRLELPSLYEVIRGALDDLEDKRDELAALGCELVIRTVMAPVDRRFFVQLLGRGVPPPHNKFRWCTPKLKVDPMAEALADLRREGETKPLLLHGVRIGESAARDGRIALACGKEDSECGQGWYQETLSDAVADKFGPILHWRVCHIARWLDTWAPQEEYGGWDTAALVKIYGGEESMEAGARFGCIECPLVTRDRSLERTIRMQEWAYLVPLTRLRPLYHRLQSSTLRLRKPPGELRKDGQPVSKQERLGPLTMEARALGLAELLAIQGEINARAQSLGRPLIDLLNAEEEARIREFWALGEWPDGWTGEEPVGETTLMPLFTGVEGR